QPSNQTSLNHFTGNCDYSFLALVLGVPLILLTVLGNVLVCLSVLTERSLKTATNYFIISLAAADLLLAVLVLPLYVYSQVSRTLFSTAVCTAVCGVFRYIAVVVPLKYNRNQFSMRQLLLIVAAWLLSLGVASPVIFGLNGVPGRDPTVCKLEDDRFVVYSSVCSFFVPCPVMLFLYYGMFRGLRRWSGRSRPAGHPALSLRLSSALRRGNATATGSEEKVVFATPGELSPASPSTISMTTPSATPLSGEQRDGAVGGAEREPMTAQTDSASDGEPTETREQMRGRRNSKSSRVSGRERKAMKVLPVVVGVFLACWTPFFVVHVTKVLCQSCDISPALISVVTWLGYVNSAVNPIIYTAFNVEFRKVFHKLLCCRTSN
uniref:Dopamine receptor D4 n=1 Tax=Sander lucioperca TaxID=283035 RepID=A0A8C9YN81_SANLU